MINVTKTYLPNKDKLLDYIDKIYDSGWITNNGPLVNELEERLAEYLGVKNIVLVSNGTVALEIAYRLLKLSGEVITTPFSFVASTSSIVSNGLKPVFADIDSKTFNLNPVNIVKNITDKTSAIVPVHVFGNACKVEEIDKIAKENNIKVIYDAAHAFGIKYKGESVLKYGDVSTLSFHATKLFHTIEGGALIINDDSLVEEARFLINFGIDGPDSVKSLGTNAKMNEFEAAMGLCVLDDIEKIIQQREKVYDRYRQGLEGLVDFQCVEKHCSLNYGYFPVLFKSEQQTLQVKAALNKLDVYPRRYFHPSLDTLPYIKSNEIMTKSRDIASRILALPMYSSLDTLAQDEIIKSIKNDCNG